MNHRLSLFVTLLAFLCMNALALAAREDYQAYSSVQKWTGQIVYRQTTIANFKVGESNVSGHSVSSGVIDMTAGNLSTDGNVALWTGSDMVTEHVHDEVFGKTVGAGVAITTTHNWDGIFQAVGGEIQINYFDGTFRAQGAGGETLERNEQHFVKSPYAGSSEEITQNFTPKSGNPWVDRMPVPVPQKGKGLALIGGKTWSEPKPTSPAGIPPEAWPMIQGTDVTYDVFWTLVPAYDDIDLVVDIDDYEKWIPQGDKNETVAGSHLHVTATLEGPGGGIPTKKARWIKFELLDTSREPGVCLNWPKEPKPPTFDLRFAENQPAPMRFDDTDALRIGDFQVAQTVGPPNIRASALVDCYDYGAWSTLRVTAELDDTRIIVGHLRTNKQNIHITLPCRENGSLIAKAWKDGRRGADVADSADVEKTADNTWDGDGFSLYEEYRGLFMDGVHRRLDPSRKDLCILDRVKGPTVRAFRMFENASQIKVAHQFREDEFRPDRVMNFNRTRRSPRSTPEFQHGLIIVEGKSNYASITFQELDSVGRDRVPKHVNRIEVAPSLLTSFRHNTIGVIPQTIFGVSVLYDNLANDLAHEIGHACGANHHGDGDLYTVLWTLDKSTTPWRIMEQTVSTPLGPNPGPARQIHVYWEGGGEMPADSSFFSLAPEPYLANYKDCQHSGDVDCMMRYEMCEAYVHPQHPTDGRILLTDHEPHGLRFCQTPTGTQINDPSRYDPSRQLWPRHGDCVGNRGNCKAILCVNDSLKP